MDLWDQSRRQRGIAHAAAGGVLTQYLSWRYTLFINLIFATVAVAGALAYIDNAGTEGWNASLTLGSLTLGAVLLTAFVVAERHPVTRCCRCGSFSTAPGQAPTSQ